MPPLVVPSTITSTILANIFTHHNKDEQVHEIKLQIYPTPNSKKVRIRPTSFKMCCMCYLKAHVNRYTSIKATPRTIPRTTPMLVRSHFSTLAAQPLRQTPAGYSTSMDAAQRRVKRGVTVSYTGQSGVWASQKPLSEKLPLPSETF